MYDFPQAVQDFVRRHALFAHTDKIVVALSGGPDSVALLRVMVDLGYQVECAHCNFHLRGDESNRDMQFVDALCTHLDIPLHVTHFQTAHYAATRHISIEMAARDLRYAWFEELRRKLDASCVAVAHHYDDSVETFLLNLCRGTGIQGLTGISPRNVHVVRPLLEQDRQSILDYLAQLGQDYVTDSTNAINTYQRNKIRNELLPLMCQLNPSVARSIHQTSIFLREVASVFHDYCAKSASNVHQGSIIDIPQLLQERAPLGILHHILSPLGFTSAQVESIHTSLETGVSGKEWRSAEWRLLRNRNLLELQPIANTTNTPQLKVTRLARDSQFVIPTSPDVACLDADKVSIPLEIRRWQPADRFVPLGMKGSKLVSDFLTNCKLSVFQKEQTYVACSNGHIVWVVGHRIDHRYRITPNTTQILMIERCH